MENNEVVFSKDDSQSALVSSAEEAIETSGGDPKEQPSFTVGGVDVSEFSAEWEKTGTLSEESFSKLEEKGFPKQLVESYIKGVTSHANTLAEADVQEVLQVAGGPEKFQAISTWAKTNLSADDLAAYNSAIQMNKATAKLAMQAVVSRYEAEFGRAPKLLGGGAASSSTGVEAFENRSDMMKAMNDKRYGRDPEYTRSVERKVLNSKLIKSS
jgi:hypothetical protein